MLVVHTYSIADADNRAIGIDEVKFNIARGRLLELQLIICIGSTAFDVSGPTENR